VKKVLLIYIYVHTNLLLLSVKKSTFPPLYGNVTCSWISIYVYTLYDHRRALRGKGDPVELVRAILLGKSLILKLWSLYCLSLQPSQSSTEDCCLLVLVSPAESDNICLQIISQTCLMRPSKGCSYLACLYIFLNTVKPALVITCIKQSLVLCNLNFYFPSQYIQISNNTLLIMIWPL
jgi:hypothetical protein